jgi:hypothetical protein
MSQAKTLGEHLYRILCDRGIVHTELRTPDELVDYEIAAHFFTQSAAACSNVNSENQGLPCTFCGYKMKRLQIDVDHQKGTLLVRINWEWTKAEALKQAEGLVQLIKQFAEGL